MNRDDVDVTTLTLLRHGQSEWNLQNRFTGWVDVNLTDRGVAEARGAGRCLKEAGVRPVIAYTSVLTRAIRTLNLALEEMGMLWLPVQKDWRLNERHYGGLTGLDKAETAATHGDDQVLIWRRSYDTPPPELAPGAEHDMAEDQRYADIGAPVPRTESLKTTLDRVAPYWSAEIAPKLVAGDDLVIAAHGNSLRAIVKLLFRVADDDIVSVEIPTGNPLVIEIEAKSGDPTPIAARYLDAERAATLPPVP